MTRLHIGPQALELRPGRARGGADRVVRHENPHGYDCHAHTGILLPDLE